MNISKMSTPQLESKINSGKLSAEQLAEAKAALAKRMAKAKDKPASETAAPKKAAKKEEKKSSPAPKKAAAKKAAEPKPAKKKAEPKAEKESTSVKSLEDYQKDGVSGLVRKMITPTDKGSKVAGCTYSQANAAVQKKFGRKLYPSEFDRNFKVLKALGIVEEKQKPRFALSKEA